MSLLATVILFAIFATNVAIGSSGGTPFLGDVGEMLLLALTSLVFVAAILKREAAAKKNK
ncbi:hypothetical protein PEL8287_01047 [Roseovarius litorisediminis]|uniref:Uncharacterized protein n=1 Tax=Roseovarius litorisediminis TaxID=1312363 RepID=A0A1Y5RRB5_9RHOB|nr:hypothetical protein [Roseovarius litorisediminis]SLN23411.1 hypothetical protein PEL8287_01047 [Roseovarius litorisediminis]